MFPLAVIIPSYNRATQVDATLHSLTRQSRKDFETILVDHGSTDNTEEICQKYQQSLNLSYYKIARDGIRFAGVPRDFGVGQTEAPLIAFLDTGMIVPSWYVESHLAFHYLHPDHIGIGFRHGYQAIDKAEQEHSNEERAAFLLDNIDVDYAYTVIKEQQLLDQRESSDLAKSPTPWFFGWTANLSLSRAAYYASGGFDLDLEGWGFEDVDLCYRLFKKGQTLAFVQAGWGIELPQPREIMGERFQTHHLNMLHCYARERSVALESMLLTEFQLNHAVRAYLSQRTATESSTSLPISSILDQVSSQFSRYLEEIFCHLTSIERNSQPSPVVPERIRARFARPTLLVGGKAEDAAHYDYVAVGDENIPSTSSLWSCWGLAIPLADDTLETVVVSDIWKQLGWSPCSPFDLPGAPLLENLITEIKRTAKKVVFLNSTPTSSDEARLVAVLQRSCQKQELEFELLSLIPA
jgi:hypothetical protein